MDLKGPGNLLYLIGETKDEMGGSHYNASSMASAVAKCRLLIKRLL
ncbi:MAG: hypothetical protein U0936_00220 [Planctomycetaceae bacterium]